MEVYRSEYITISKIEPKLYVLDFQKIDPNRQVFDMYLAAMEKIYLSDTGIVFIFDATHTGYLSSEMRIRQGEWLIEKEALLKASCIGHIYVINNVIINMMLKGIFLIKKTPVAHKVLSNMPQALQEARQWLSQNPKN